ncbi:hyaluronidase [Sphingobacterium allocomposti]|uniref:Hyaluronidase n=1 Tax=Sphingobacterium allocomposti TaxID=415956 RepID=A0A5S5DHF2_9SPHI|nr:hypothetical protein [Sphingobacterium composti Yoo et al. 2007 non Ten et al. 2007]TYP94606.1 hyaluronidase [Sphingobacterium composti Yoo et al. 2007 non Ten et al. 2007]
MRSIFLLISASLALVDMAFAQKLYFVVEDNNLVKRNPAQVNFVRSNQLSEAIVFYQDDFVTHDLKQNYKRQLLEKSIEKRIPDKMASGLALLDWEGEKAQILYGLRNVSRQRYQEVLNEFITCIRDAKKMRPNIKWSFYGLPVRVLNNHTYAQWSGKMLKLKSLFSEMDYICPNLYMFIRNDKSKYKEDIRQHLLLSLKLGAELNKDVLPLIWHRYQTNSELIKLDDFGAHLNIINSVSFQGRKITGIIWWNSEEFNFIRRQRYPKINAEYKTVKDKGSYQTSLLRSYLKETRKHNIK